MIKTITTTERYKNGELIERMVEEVTDDCAKDNSGIFITINANIGDSNIEEVVNKITRHLNEALNNKPLQ